MMFEDSGNGRDVVLQWIDRDYLEHDKKEYYTRYKKEHGFFDRSGRREEKERYLDELEEIENITVGPDEYAVILNNGKVESVNTQSQIDALPGFWKRFKERFSGTRDIQLILVNTRRRSMQVPFQAYTKDRVPIKGAVDLFAQVNPQDIPLVLRIIKEVPGVSSKPGFREISSDDIKQLISRNLDYIIDTESFSNKMAEDVEKDRKGICLDLVSALNSKTPYWANYGLIVNYSSIVIDENRYEELERIDADNRLKVREMEIARALFEAGADDKIRTEDIMQRERALRAASAQIADYGAQVALSAGRKDMELSQENDAAEVAVRRLENSNQYELMKAYHEMEMRRIKDTDIDDTEKQFRIAEIKNRITQIDMQRRKDEYQMEKTVKDDDIARQESVKDKELQRQIDLMNAKAKAVRDMCADDVEIRKMELASGIDAQRQQAEMDKAVAEAKFEGYKEASAIDHERNVETLEITKGMLAAANKGEVVQSAPVCPGCGRLVRRGDSFCGGCGYRLGGGQ